MIIYIYIYICYGSSQQVFLFLKTQNSKLKTQNSKLKTQNSKLKTQNSKVRLDVIKFIF